MDNKGFQLINVIIGTGNKHKVQEYQYLLGSSPDLQKDVKIDISLQALPEDLKEDGNSFEENALIKLSGLFHNLPSPLPAKELKSSTEPTASNINGTKYVLLCEDSGLEIHSLGGEPGIYSARYGNLNLNASERNALVMKRLQGKVDRSARFSCVIAAIALDQAMAPVKPITLLSGYANGSIAEKYQRPQGNFFGYDPIFIPEGYSESYYSLGSEKKSRLSHRARACDKFSRWLIGIIGNS